MLLCWFAVSVTCSHFSMCTCWIIELIKSCVAVYSSCLKPARIAAMTNNQTTTGMLCFKAPPFNGHPAADVFMCMRIICGKYTSLCTACYAPIAIWRNDFKAHEEFSFQKKEKKKCTVVIRRFRWTVHQCAGLPAGTSSFFLSLQMNSERTLLSWQN